jgi:hypothetical protein
VRERNVDRALRRDAPTPGAASLSMASPYLSISVPSAIGLPSRAERIHPLPVDFARGKGLLTAC